MKPGELYFSLCIDTHLFPLDIRVNHLTSCDLSVIVSSSSPDNVYFGSSTTRFKDISSAKLLSLSMTHVSSFTSVTVYDPI